MNGTIRTLPSINMELFNSKFSKTDGCWLWSGSMFNNGYGKIGRMSYMAHRIAYEVTNGPIPKGMVLDHLCRVRHCVNPDHLEVVSNVENVMRGESFSAKNARKTHCKQGHEFTPGNTYRPPKRPNRRYCIACQKDRDKQHNIRTMDPTKV